MKITKLDNRFSHFKHGFTHRMSFLPTEYNKYDKVYIFLRSQYDVNWVKKIEHRAWDSRFNRPTGEYQIFVRDEAIITMALLS
jgi:hypothetical protein